MKVIGHDHECVQPYKREMARDAIPRFKNDLSQRCERHIRVSNFAKYGLALMRHNGHEIRAVLGVIIIFQADGMTMVVNPSRWHGDIVGAMQLRAIKHRAGVTATALPL